MCTGVINMTDQNDHDLLISLNTKIEMMFTAIQSYNVQTNSQITTLVGRVTALETGDGRDSERMQAIQKDLADLLKNAQEVPSIQTRINDLEKRVDDLNGKSDRWNILNSIAVGIGVVLAYIFGR
jgi:hypothetical protein